VETAIVAQVIVVTITQEVVIIRAAVDRAVTGVAKPKIHSKEMHLLVRNQLTVESMAVVLEGQEPHGAAAMVLTAV
jgi:hypothetical protein